MENEMSNNELKIIFDQYASRLPEKIQKLVTLWRQLKSHFTTENLTELYRAAHNLNSSAGTYGYLELEQAASKLELTLKAIVGGDQTFTHSEQAVDAHLDEIKHVALSRSDEKAYSHFLQRNTIK